MTETQVQEIPVTLDMLLQIFTDLYFYERIQEITALSDTKQRETGFSVYQDAFSKSYLIGEVEIGNSDGRSMGGQSIDTPLLDEPDGFPLIALHVHDSTHSLFPSTYLIDSYEGEGGDLYSWNTERRDNLRNGVDNKQLNGTCKRAPQNRVHLFLVQQRTPKALSTFLLRDVAEQIYGDSTGEWRSLSEQEMVERYNRTRLYHAAILTLTNKGFSKKDLEKLRNFCYTISFKDFI